MNKIIVALFVAVCAGQTILAQKGIDKESTRQARSEARQELAQSKRQALMQVNMQPAAQPTPNNFNDTDSFGQNAQFLGSMYAGTVYVYHSCDPAVLLSEIGLTLASDDHCVEKPDGGRTGTPGGSFLVTTFDDVWQITIPKNTVQNVIYPLVNNSFEVDNESIAGIAQYSYSPVVTIVSEALNDPAAIDPNTGLPMNGSYTTSLGGSTARVVSVTPGQYDSTSYASVGARGFSRAYFRALGLPNNVINKLFKKDITLKFGIRVGMAGALDYGQFFYQFRLLGQ